MKIAPGLPCLLALMCSCQIVESSYCGSYDPACNPLVYSLLYTATGRATIERHFVQVPLSTNVLVSYRLDERNGTLTASAESPIASNAASGHPSGRYLYSSLFQAAPDNIRGYSVNSVTGAVTPTTIPVATANNSPTYMDFHPLGRFAYAINYNSLDITAFHVEDGTGSLTRIADFASGCACSNLAQIRVSPDGKFLYVTANGGAEPISGFTIDQSTGALASIGNAAGAVSMDSVLVDPASRYLYAVSLTGTILGYSINATTGVLSALPGSPFAGQTGNFRAAMHPQGKHLYTVNTSSVPVALARHDIAADGALSAAVTLTFGTNLQYVTLDPSGKFGFINHGASNDFYVFSIDPGNGSVSLLNGGNPYVASGNPGEIAVMRTRE